MLDISKAFDRVEWSFLKQVMERLNFSDKWMALIMNYIFTTTFFVI